MLIVPVSLTFFSVPVSSSALACQTTSAAASARPIIGRRFIRALLAWMDWRQACKIRAGRKSAFRPPTGPHMQWPSHRMGRLASLRLVGIGVGRIRRFCKFVLELSTDRRVQVQALGRDLLHEPFVVELLAPAARLER